MSSSYCQHCGRTFEKDELKNLKTKDGKIILEKDGHYECQHHDQDLNDLKLPKRA